MAHVFKILQSSFKNINLKLTIKLRLILFGLALLLVLLFFIISSSITNLRVSRDVIKAENITIYNNEFLNGLYILDLIQISQSQLLGIAKDIIINKDEVMIAPQRMIDIESESKLLYKNIEKMLYFINNNKEINFNEEQKQVFKKDIQMVDEYSKKLVSGTTINLNELIKKRHDTLTIINDEYTKIEGLVEGTGNELSVLLSFLEDELFLNNKNDLQRLKDISEVINGLRIEQSILILQGIGLIKDKSSLYLNDKNITQLKETTINLDNKLELLSKSLINDKEISLYNSYNKVYKRLKNIILNNLFSLIERSISEQSSIELDFLLIDYQLSENSKVIQNIISELSDDFTHIIMDTGTLLTATQNNLKKKVSVSTSIILFVAIASIIIVVLFFTILTNGIISPLSEAVVMAEAIKNGDYSHRLKIERDDEIGELSDSLDEMASQIELYTNSIESNNIELEKEIKERKLVLKALKKSESRNSALLSAIPDFIFVFNKDGQFLDYNIPTMFENVLDVHPNEVLGKNIKEFFPTFADTALSYISEVAETKKSLDFEFSIDFEKESRIFEARQVLAGDDQILTLIRDISDRKKREIELQQKTDEMIRFTYTVSHDLRSPLVTIKSFLAYLEEDIKTNNEER